MEQEKSNRPFRVIVVGAGLVGLSLSHALQLANIEHVVLEKQPKVVSLYGAALMIYPGCARIFDQFGILGEIKKTISPITSECQRWPDGTVNIEGSMLQTITKRFDLPVILFDRQRCIKHLYTSLPDQSRVRTNARVERIEHLTNGVKVFLADGTVEEADIVIGADGVHSHVRQLMWEYAAKEEPGTIPESDKSVMFTQYKAMFGVGKKAAIPELGNSDVNLCYGHGVTKLIFTQPGMVYWAVSFKDEYSQPPKRYRPNAAEQNEVASRFKDIQMTEKTTFGDLWDSKSWGGVLNLEEGILGKWHSGRIVLVGDSAHKMTADLGIGANTAIESAIVLCNILQYETKNNPNRHFTNSELSTLFTEYQDKRYERAKKFIAISGGITRMRSYESIWKRIFIARIVTLPVFQRYQAKKMMLAFAKSPKLAYVPTQTINDDADGWKMADEANSPSSVVWVLYALITSFIGAALSYLALSQWGAPLLHIS